PNDDLWLGRILGGKYRILSRIGQGTTGSVYAAEQTPLGRRVAVKVLDLVDASSEMQSLAKARFLREASLLSRLDHPNTVRVFDYGTYEEHSWLAMELCRGQSLDAMMVPHRPMDPLRLTRIMIQVCGSLQEAHELGLVHRDLKPANILVETAEDGRDRAKVVDFGLVKPFDDSEQLTQRGLLVGTPMFMSPEQVRGQEDIDPRSDLYAIGVLLYRGLTGEYPFDQSSIANVLIAHVKDPPKRFPTLTDVPRSLQRLVALLLEKDRNRRPDSVATVAHQLEIIERVLVGELSDQMALASIEPASMNALSASYPTGIERSIIRSAHEISTGSPPGAISATTFLWLGVALLATAFISLSGGYFVAQMVVIYLGS
ncbi:MAG: serine/threonine-protein kinase, partial [Myxococcota bacterium]